MTKTNIAWTDETWNPVTGCSKVSPGCALASYELSEPVATNVVPADKPARSVAHIVTLKLSSTTTGALYDRVVFIWSLPLMVLAAMGGVVVVPARNHFKILRAIVRLIAVAVVDDLAPPERPSEHRLRHEAMLVDVATRVCAGMVALPDKDIAVRCDRATALPVGVFCG